MKKHIRILSVVICIALMITTLSIGTLTASAASSGYYTYTVSNDSATITDVSTSISGKITVP